MKEWRNEGMEGMLKRVSVELFNWV